MTEFVALFRAPFACFALASLARELQQEVSHGIFLFEFRGCHVARNDPSPRQKVTVTKETGRLSTALSTYA